MASATVIVDCIIRDTDPTGDVCDGCPETPWLRAVEIVVEATGERLAYLCSDCEQLMRDQAGEIS